MTDLRQAATLALEALEYRGGSTWLKQGIAAEALRAQLAQPEQEPDRQALQAAGTHPAPCARHCEAKAFEIEIRSLKSALKHWYSVSKQQAEQEPVAWIERDMQCDDFDPDSVTCEKQTIAADGWEWIPLYTTPPAAQPEQEPVAKVVSTAPDRIWLDLGFDPQDETEVLFGELHDVTWSADNATGYGIEYVRTTPPLPEQEPTPWRDMIVVSLVREGINKHRARELADHFAAAQLEPTCPECKAGVLYECVACSSNNYPPKPEQEPVAWAVQGITQMIRGEFAELDAKSKARRIGGTCVGAQHT
jgi:hypothetical protein